MLDTYFVLRQTLLWLEELLRAVAPDVCMKSIHRPLPRSSTAGGSRGRALTTLPDQNGRSSRMTVPRDVVAIGHVNTSKNAAGLTGHIMSSLDAMYLCVVNFDDASSVCSKQLRGAAQKSTQPLLLRH